jgi:beta-mannosidase
MKKTRRYVASRRQFMQLTGAGAWTALNALRSDGRSAAPDGDPSSESALMPGNPATQEAHPTLNLNGTWSVTPLPLEAEGESGYSTFKNSGVQALAAQVPGEIHLDLMRVGRMPDPNISDNARTKCRWPEKNSWWYRTEFTVPPGFRQHLRQRLIFEGIDLYGQVFVNGKLAGATKDAFSIFELDVNHLLQEGSNELVVRVTSGTELAPRTDSLPAPQGEPSKADPVYAPRQFDQRRFLRKPPYSYGWDWCDPLPNIGIWRGVRLEGRSKVVIDHLRLDTAIRGKEVSLEGEVTLENLHPWIEIPYVLELRLKPPKGEALVQRHKIDAQVGRSAVPCRMVIPDAELWWPNGMGGQPLYELTARVLCGDEETDRQVQTLGLRTIELDRSPQADGSRFCFKVNGHDVYCKGGNWAPADLIPARIDSERYQKLVAEARNAHFTMFRVNGVGLYESDEFYNACDRAGILVWQDFTFSCTLYPDQDPEFVARVRQEAEGVVKTLRHHPSLALWCGNNECIVGMAEWWKVDSTKTQDIGGVKIYNEVLPDICRFYDPVRTYRPGSPFGGVDPNKGTAGDKHGWNESGFGDDKSMRRWQEFADECQARFLTEYYCLFGPPNMASVREYLKPDELSVESTAWKIHTNQFENGATAKGIRYHYGDPQGLSLPQFVLYGQMYQSLLQGGGLESMRFRKGDPKAECQGALVWSYNDCWGENGWTIIDHYVRRKASYYWFKRAAAPVKVLTRSREGHLVTRVVNDNLKAYQAEVHCGWVRLDGKAREWQKHSVTIPANGMIEVARAPIPSPSERNPREWLYAATLAGEGIPSDQAIWLLAPHRELAMAKPVLSTTVQNGVLEASSPVYCHGVHIEDEGHEVITDNYFELLPGIPRRISITTPTPSGTYPLNAVMPIGS